MKYACDRKFIQVYACQKITLKRVWFNRVVAKINLCSFLGHSVVFVLVKPEVTYIGGVLVLWVGHRTCSLYDACSSLDRVPLHSGLDSATTTTAKNQKLGF